MDQPTEPNYNANCVIVDDDISVTRIMSRIVTETLGKAPATFENPSDALDYAAVNRDIGVILLDWHIGEINGLEWIDPLSREWPSAVFVVISADSDPRGYIEVSKKCSLALWWRKTDSVAMLASLLNVAKGEHERRVSGDGFKTLAEIKDKAIRGAIAHHVGDLEMAAKELGISASTIRRHLAND